MFTVARNNAIDVLTQQKRQNEVSNNLTPLVQSEYSLVPTVRELVNTNTIDDDQLRMMFVCCHPALSTEAQVSLILNTLCGFSVTEIAKAFEDRLTKPEDIILDDSDKNIQPKIIEKKKDNEASANPLDALMNMGGSATANPVENAFMILPQGMKAGSSWTDTLSADGIKTSRTYI